MYGNSETEALRDATDKAFAAKKDAIDLMDALNDERGVLKRKLSANSLEVDIVRTNSKAAYAQGQTERSKRCHEHHEDLQVERQVILDELDIVTSEHDAAVAEFVKARDEASRLRAEYKAALERYRLSEEASTCNVAPMLGDFVCVASV